ncbi:MAG TPA: NlpC/P60 family protein [Acidimicrobiales bacterium]|nr:NlpC/P60 family protein [Acidimicrobiales bacterium]
MALAAGVSTTLVPRGPAGAATEASLRAQAAALTARLGQLAQQEARVDEQYNQAQLALAAAQTRQQQAQAAADRAAAQVRARRQVLTAAAVDAYMRGGSGAGAGGVTLLMQASQTTYGIQQSYLQSVADTQQSAIDGLRQAQAQLSDRQTRLAQATRSARSDVARAAGLRSQLSSTAASEVSALSQVKGQLARLVAADQAAAQRAQAAAARARLVALSRVATSSARPVTRDNPLPTLGGVGGGGGGTGGSGGSGAAPIGPAPTQSGAAGVALEWAQRELGKPYVYGASGPDSFDCSGLTMYVYGKAGVGLPHSAAGQWDDTTRISYADARPGDLVFFYQPVDHVGIYVGNGEMIDAPHTGASVEYDPIWWNVLDGFGRVS